MADNFDKVIDHLIINEGGYVNHPADPGGRTIYGVTWRNWIAHLKRYSQHEVYLVERWRPYTSLDERGHPFFDVKLFKVNDFKALNPSDVKFFYFKDYWEPCKGEELPAGIDYYQFDFSVNSGPRQAALNLQRIVGVADDGKVGDKTIAATHDYCQRNGTKRLLKELDRSRREFLSKLRNASFFIKGWNNRLDKVMSKCYELIGDIYYNTKKPLDRSRTIKAASTEAKVAAGAIAVGSAAPEQDKLIQATETIVDNLSTVNTISSVIRNLYTYGWMLPLIIMFGFACYYAYIRRDDWFKGKE